MALAGTATAMCSCKKELNEMTLNSTITQKQTSSIAAAVSTTNPNYGSLIDAMGSSDPYSFRMSVAGKLKISCLRDGVPIPTTRKVQSLGSAYNIVLNFNNANTVQPAPFETDIPTYKNDLKSALNTMTVMPVLAVVENEESNTKFYSGTATQYITQLKAAIPILHSYGIAVANGGLTSTGLKYCVYQDYMARGMTTEAKDYQSRTKIAVNNATSKDRGACVSTLLQNYAKMDLDYINFHWRAEKPEDIQAIVETIDYIKRVTGKPVITNEIGQYDTSSATVTALMDMAKSQNLKYFLWYSGDDGGRSTPLHNADGTLTPTGNTYSNYLSAL